MRLFYVYSNSMTNYMIPFASLPLIVKMTRTELGFVCIQNEFINKIANFLSFSSGRTRLLRSGWWMILHTDCGLHR
jgi:hypothetical protein